MHFDLSDDQRMWQRTVHEFVSKEVKPKAHEVDQKSEFNWDAVKKMGALGLLGLSVPEEYGGAGVDAISAAIAIEELGWGCGSTALAIAAHNGLGCAPVAMFGSKSVCEVYLPPVVDGAGKLASLALTEPGAGSDLKGGIQTRAERKSDEWVINGSKMWCTNASIADFIVALVRSDLAGGSHSLSLILIPTNSNGVHIGPPEKKMGLKGSPTHAVIFSDVHVPLENLLGKPGEGLYQTLSILDGGRVGIGALAIGLAQAALDESIKYASERQAFGQRIGNYQAIQWMIADAFTEIQAARWMVYQAAWLKGLGKPYTREASMAKLFATEMAERVTRNAIQIHGGYGYSSEFPVERIYRDARLMTIGEGTSEIQRLIIARSLLQ